MTLRSLAEAILSSLFPPVFALARAGLVDDDCGEQGQLWLEALPDPAGQVLRRGVRQALDLVEVVVVELLADRPAGFLDVAVVDQVAALRVHFARDDDLDVVAVPVQPATPVPLRERRQRMGRLKRECLGQANLHGIPTWPSPDGSDVPLPQPRADPSLRSG